MATLTPQQALDLAVAGGFYGDGLRIILAIARAESGLNPDATNTLNNTPPSTDRGILQINSYWHSEVTDDQAFDPAWSFAWAFRETKQGTDFHEWATYTSGRYKDYLMALLPNFPMKDQRNEKTLDGNPPENGDFDCVPESFAAAIEYETGKYVSGDELKDAEYGQSYANAGTSMARFVDQATDRARAVYGVTAKAFTSNTTVDLIRQARTWLKAGYPVIATIPSAWGTAHTQAELLNPSFSSHVVCFYGQDASSLTAMNPWGGFEQTEPDSWWADRLCYGQVWQVYRESGAAPAASEDYMTVLQVNQTLNYFHTISTDDTAWRCNVTSQPVIGSVLKFYRQIGGPGFSLQGLSLLGLPMTGELAPDSAYRGRYQVFEKGIICFDPDGKWDKPAGWDAVASFGCYLPHLDSGFAHDYLLQAVNDQLVGLQKQLVELQAQLADAKLARQNAENALLLTSNKVDALTKQEKEVQAALDGAQQQILQLQAQLDAGGAALKGLLALKAALAAIPDA